MAFLMIVFLIFIHKENAISYTTQNIIIYASYFCILVGRCDAILSHQIFFCKLHACLRNQMVDNITVHDYSIYMMLGLAGWSTSGIYFLRNSVKE